MNPPFKTIGVVGLGVMGFDIAFLYAMKGFQTLVYDAAKPAMESLLERREQTIERLRKRDRLSDSETDQVRNLLVPVQTLGSLARSNLLTEAVSESAQTKLAVYQSLHGAGFKGLLTTNTSSLTRASLVESGVIDARHFALTHFFNPVLYTQTVEVVTGGTDAAEAQSLVEFLRALGRRPVTTRDISGFVSNGILMIYAVMALRLLERGARVEQVDQVAKSLRLLPPFISFDSWKPSIVEAVTRSMGELRGDAFLRSSKLLTRLAVDNPRFYRSGDPNPQILEMSGAASQVVADDDVKRALWTSMLIAAARVAELGETPAVVDQIATEGIKMPKPPLKEIDRIGVTALLNDLDETNRVLGEDPLPAPAALLAMARQPKSFYADVN